MARARRRPTAGELEILRVLWSQGPSTVRQVARELGRETAYTTILKQLQMMTDKRLVRRDASARSHIYAANCGAEETERQIVSDLLERVFDGSAVKLMMRALAAAPTSADELNELRKVIDQHRGGRR